MNDDPLTPARFPRQIAGCGDVPPAQCDEVETAAATIQIATEDPHPITGSMSSRHECRSALADCLSIFAQRGKALRLGWVAADDHDITRGHQTLGGEVSKANAAATPLQVSGGEA